MKEATAPTTPDRREIVEKAKKYAEMELSTSVATAKLAVEYGGKSADYIGHFRQACKELTLAEKGYKAVVEFVSNGGTYQRFATKLADATLNGPAKPELPFPALYAGAHRFIGKIIAEDKNLGRKAWSERLNFYKAVIENDDVADLYAVRFPQDSVVLRQKVAKVAHKQLDESAAILLNIKETTQKKKAAEKAAKKAQRNAKKARIRRTAQKASQIFGLSAS